MSNPDRDSNRGRDSDSDHSTNEGTQIVVPRDIITRKADSRGRFSLGSSYAGKEVTVAVIDVAEPDAQADGDGDREPDPDPDPDRGQDHDHDGGGA